MEVLVDIAFWRFDDISIWLKRVSDGKEIPIFRDDPTLPVIGEDPNLGTCKPGTLFAPLRPFEGNFYYDNANGVWELSVFTFGGNGTLFNWCLRTNSSLASTTTTRTDVTTRTRTTTTSRTRTSTQTATRPGYQRFCSSNVPATIGDLSTTVNSIVVPISGTVSGLAVDLSITHDFIEDLKVVLSRPDGRNVTLFADVECGFRLGPTMMTFEDSASKIFGRDMGNDTVTCFGTLYRPEQPLSVFSGQSPNGAWSLSITDQSEGVSGTMQSWCLHIKA
ncbi:hypothetical protein DFJ74DRAFT_691921 [Hyaloraphidium curvatum]|nr:hypothetical protein DFJ74DRAFT_691921 [Hyaloraphidium curvatum]